MIQQSSVRLLVAVAVAACAIVTPVRAQSSLEYNVKAALLLNFARFIEWPEHAFAGERAPIDVCVLSPNPFGGTLDRTLQGETVGDRPLSARTVQGATDSVGCHLLFVPGGAEPRAVVLFRYGASHTVTVGESASFEDQGGAVTLVLEAGRVRFNVNLSPVEDRGIRISARMLQLANRVDRVRLEK